MLGAGIGARAGDSKTWESSESDSAPDLLLGAAAGSNGGAVTCSRVYPNLSEDVADVFLLFRPISSRTYHALTAAFTAGIGSLVRAGG